MVDQKRLSGAWSGRLVDVQGFEGELELVFKIRQRGRVDGHYGVAIGASHSSLVRRGELKGTWKDGVLTFAFEFDKPRVKVALRARALALRDGGVGLSGVYQVSARGFSPLQGGVMSASKDRPNADEVMSREKAA